MSGGFQASGRSAAAWASLPLRRNAILLIPIVAGVLLLVLSTWWGPKQSYEMRGTTHVGLGALVALYEVLGYEVEPMNRSWAELPTDRPNLLLIIRPTQLGALDRQKLVDWISLGNWALIAGFDQFELISSLLQEPEMSVRTRRLLMSDIDRLDVRGVARLPKGFLGGEVVAADGMGPIALHFSIGSGHLVWTVDRGMATNARISKADNVILMTNIATASGAHHIWFVNGARNQSLTQVATSPVPPAVTWHFIALLAICIWTYGRRFGAPIALVEGASPSMMEYVRGIAGLYSRARARSLALERLYRDLLRLISEGSASQGPAGLPTGADLVQTAAAVAHRKGLNGGERKALLELIEECERRIRPPLDKRLSERDLLRLGLEIERWRCRLFGTREEE